MDSTNQKRLPADAHTHRDVFQDRLPWQEKVKLIKQRRHFFYHHGDTICHPKSHISADSRNKKVALTRHINCFRRRQFDNCVVQTVTIKLLRDLQTTNHVLLQKHHPIFLRTRSRLDQRRPSFQRKLGSHHYNL